MPITAAPERTATETSRAIDVGRLICVACVTLAVVLNVFRLRTAELAPINLVSTTVVLSFYLLLAIQYLRRGPAHGTDRRLSTWIIALAGTLSPFAIPLLSNAKASEAMTTLGLTVSIISILGALWALAHLGSNISIIPQARGLTTSGPYRFFRHPLYVFEFCSAIGISLVNGFGLNWLVLPVMAALLATRAHREEQLLTETLAGYAEYRSTSGSARKAR